MLAGSSSKEALVWLAGDRLRSSHPDESVVRDAERGGVKLVAKVPLAEFEQQDIVRVSYPPYDVVVVKTESGFHALEDACNHAGASLSEGWVEDGCLMCPVHAYAFKLETGALVRPKGLCADQRTFQTRTEGPNLLVYDPFKLVLIG